MMEGADSNKILCVGRIIDVDIYYYDKKNRENKAVSIVTPKTGLKPDISVTLNVIPSNNISSMTVIIRNMILDFDISKAYYMSVKMGYETCGVAVYESVVFRSYQATPNPDGEFVFEGVVTGDSTGYQNDISVIEEDPFTLIFNDCGTESVYSFIHYILNGHVYGAKSIKEKKLPKFQFEVKVDDIDLKSRLMQYKINVNKNTKGFATPLSRAVYAKQILTNYAESVGENLAVLIEGNKFYIKTLETSSTVPDTAIDIIGYNSASFNGAYLSLTMPYYPAINAGSLLRCDASFASQIGLPNETGNTVLKKNSSWSLYRVNKFSISFSTVRENSMSIDAFPIKEAGKVHVSDTKVTEGVKRNQYSGNYVEYVLNKEYESRDNYGKSTLGDIVSDNNVITAMKNSNTFASGFAEGGEPVKYDRIYDQNLIAVIKALYGGFVLHTIPADDSPIRYSREFSVDMLFPVIFEATWYKNRNGDNIYCECPPYYPIGFKDGYICKVDVNKFSTEAWYKIVGILNDFIDIYEDKEEYSGYVNIWKFLREHVKGFTVSQREVY